VTMPRPVPLADHLRVVEIHRAHRWGKAVCDVRGATAPIWSTPAVPEHNADRIRKFSHRHGHGTDPMLEGR